jgi:serpin B
MPDVWNRPGRRRVEPGMDSFAARPLSRRTLLAGLAALAAVPLAGCGSSEDLGPALLSAKDVAWTAPPSGAPVGAVADGMAAFAYALCRSASSGRNVVLSPASIAIAFAMARVGAVGATAASLDRFFGFPASGRDDAFNALIRSVQTVAVPPKPSHRLADPTKPPSPPIVSIGDALFPALSTKLDPAFLRTLAASYGTGVRPVDFGSRSAVDGINAWVAAQTAGRITKVWDALDPSTTLVLANTVYLKADWRYSFLEEPSTPQPFTRSDGSTSTVSMMHQSAISTRYWSDASGRTAVELPFVGGAGKPSLFMWILLPASGGDPVEMLRPNVIGTVAAGLASADISLSVPKWDFSAEFDLGSVLPRLGLTDVFDTGDFSGIGPNVGTLSTAIHKANITVDEYGTEAAATTDLAFAASARVPSPIAFVADRPFAFCVVSGESHAPLFSGVVADPSQRD